TPVFRRLKFTANQTLFTAFGGRNLGPFRSRPESNLLPTIIVSPNPVPAGEGAGTTTITGNTRDNTMGYVYVSVNDREESLFARSPQGFSAANWIQTGLRYQFRLYDGTERGNCSPKRQ